MELWIGGVRLIREVDSLFPPEEPHWERDFDILCILDACRVDQMQDACDRKEWLPPRESVDTLWSVGSTSEEWMAGMFDPNHYDEMENTAYVTANLFIEKFDFNQFGVCSIVSGEYHDIGDIRAVDPQEVTDRAIHVWRNREQYDVDRMIVHYMQPHTPFRSREEWFYSGDLVDTNWGHGFYELAAGRLPHDEFHAAYWDNLDWVLEHIDVLRQNCSGTIVLSADHGNAMGEWGTYGHPYGVPVPAVRSVPYLQIDGIDEGKYKPGLDKNELLNRSDLENVEDHLSNLGYV
jgi:hypothetical protein